MKKAEIKESLITQLRGRGADVPHFLSLIDDYMFLYDQVQKMKKEIRQKGMTYDAVSAAGKEYEKENPAVKNIVVFSRQMLSILKELNLSTDGVGALEDDEL